MEKPISHTPTPWEVHGTSICHAPKNIGDGVTQADWVCDMSEDDLTEEEVDANSNFITQACNNHDALVSALDLAYNRLIHVHALTEWTSKSLEKRSNEQLEKIKIVLDNAKKLF